MSTATALYENGQITLPPEVQELMNLSPKEELSLICDDDEIVIRRAPKNNGSWVDILLACPCPFEVPRSNESHSSTA